MILQLFFKMIFFVRYDGDFVRARDDEEMSAAYTRNRSFSSGTNPRPDGYLMPKEVMQPQDNR